MKRKHIKIGMLVESISHTNAVFEVVRVWQQLVTVRHVDTDKIEHIGHLCLTKHSKNRFVRKVNTK